jgi:hypothetical protein
VTGSEELIFPEPVFFHEDGGSGFLGNVSKYLPVYMATDLRK